MYHMQATPKQTYLTEIPAKKDSVSSESSKKMAAPTDHSQRVSSEPQEDCRDYLRTGRCKYGASCKYNHPPNVQSGGGMKGPIDPSEPLFPLRPNEPPCQYYMKHGTCKFGQACKFHHPPQSALRGTLVGGGPIVMNVGSGRSSDAGVAQHIVLKRLGSEHGANSSGMTLQFLPQRPDEADCIYFLRNGRCKYGATCRYHHPISVQHRKQTDTAEPFGRQSQQQPSSRAPMDGTSRSASMPEMRSQPVQFVSQQHSSASYGQHRNVGSSVGGPTHILVADGSLSFVTMNNSAGVPSMDSPYHHLGTSPNSGTNQGNQGYCSVPSSPLMTSSSVASSYETATSEGLCAGAGDSWNRPSRTASGGSLSALAGAESPSQVQPHYRRSGNRVAMPTSASDTNIAGRHHPVSIGNIGGQYIDSTSSYNIAGWSTTRQTTQRNRGMHEGNYEHRYHATGNPYGSAVSDRAGVSEGEVDFYQKSRIHSTARMPGRHSSRSTERHQHQPRRRSSGFDDDGMSKMTSALLTMLDTPEEAGADRNDHYDSSSSTENFSGTFSSEGGTANANQYSGSHFQERGNSLSNSQDVTASRMISSGYTPNRESYGVAYHDANARHQPTMNGDVGISANWSPTFQGAASIGRPLEQNVQSMSALHPRPSAPPNSPYGGLFLS